MSRIDELVEELCPDGVHHVELGEVASYSDTRVEAQSLEAATFVGVDNLVADKRGRAIASYAPNTSRLAEYLPGDVLIGNIRPYLRKIWLATDRGGCSGDVLCIRIKENERGDLLPKFLYYLLSSDDFFTYDMQHAKGAKMPRGDKAAILRYRVPVPPLEVQREIVRILDEFTQLEAELEAELEKRRHQYEYYRNQLLRLPEVRRWTTLGDICTRVSSGGTPKAGSVEYYRDGSIPWLRTNEVQFGEIWETAVKITDRALEETSAKWIPAKCVIVAISGATAGRSAVNMIPLTTNQHCCNLEIDPNIANFKFVFYWVAAHYEDLKSKGRGARADLNSQLIKDYPIAIPEWDEQNRIVELLDKFDALVNDLSAGLPAELNSRRKQYEYYRDQLLTFKELHS